MKGTILVVDDDDAMQITISSILEDEGYEVVCAGNGVQALAQLDHLRPRLIVLDIAMPEMNGYQFADELGRRGLRGAVPIMVLTADGRAPQKAARVGAEGYLAKPFLLDALLAEVGRLAAR